MLSRGGLDDASKTLGDVLASRDLEARILIVGGSSLLLLGIIERPTADVDVIGTAVGTHYERSRSLSKPLAAAVRDTGKALGLKSDWLNVGPASLFDFGLPDGYESRVTVLRFSTLEVHVAGRFDLICFKLYAAVDQWGPRRSKHLSDLEALTPSVLELQNAARWTRTHDSSEAFESGLVLVLREFGAKLGDDDH